MTSFPQTACPVHNLPLAERPDSLLCPEGCSYPIKGGVPRFVATDGYVSRFGFQWNTFAKSQLDSYTGQPVSRDRLQRLCGGDLSVLKDKLVLEAGCGAGRFTEVILNAGGTVVAMDLSSAVEANQANNGANPSLQIHQADIEKLPYAPGQFDVVICVGVLQATPDPERAIAALAAQLKPGGLLVIDHYGMDYTLAESRRVLRKMLLALPDSWSIPVVRAVVNTLWPIHRMFWHLRAFPIMVRLRERFVKLSPVLDYHTIYPQLPPHILHEWAILDTHDNTTDHFKHLRAPEDTRRTLETLGLEGIVVERAGNGVEARAVRPTAA
ncbi:MAG: 2-polyprenyl-3-methyl-5-hydroxy-6-metoxy-1 4-benzoquinol [Desulfovibrionaceae bacterium]|nr:MAG: 2-polyprenyl-3-methyl-5-hydroxy-6-metoxy-1 4-benzoquinol [Desulfovibrionaceae bacterium]